MDKVVLELEFFDANEKTSTIRIDDPKDDLTGEVIAGAMDSIVAANVFTNKGIPYAKLSEARAVTRSVKTFELV